MMLNSVKPHMGIIITLVLLSLSGLTHVCSQTNWNPVAFSGFMEMGQLVNAQYFEDPEGNYNGQVIPRLGVKLKHEAVIKNNLELKIGVGGLFWYAFFPHDFEFWWVVPTKFGPGISIARARYTFGDAKNSSTYLQLGFFPVKYNRDASNLGEYLFRSNVYPGFVTTGGWVNINSAAYMGQGALFHFENFEGRLKHDFTLFMERDFWPYSDFTPSYLVKLDLGPINIGAGISFHHFLPVKPSLLKPQNPANHYIEYRYFPATRDIDSLIRPSGTLGIIEKDIRDFKVKDTLSDRDPVKDSIFVSLTDRDLFVYRDDPAYIADSSGFESIERHKRDFYYTCQGIKLMLMFSYQVGENFRLFTEAALLGVKNYDYLYENPFERLPVMFGIELPTLGILDFFSLQGEYYNSPWTNSMDKVLREFTPLPKRPHHYRQDVPEYKWDLKGDNFHWSILGRRQLYPGLVFFMQVASDHLRLLTWRGVFTSEPLTQKPSNWYYMTKIEFGI